MSRLFRISCAVEASRGSEKFTFRARFYTPGILSDTSIARYIIIRSYHPWPVLGQHYISISRRTDVIQYPYRTKT